MDLLYLSDCIIEYGIAYKHHAVNDGLLDKQSDEFSCRSFCKTRRAPYFEYVKPDSSYDNGKWQKSCWCLTSKAGRVEQAGSVSGDTSCATGKVDKRVK